MATEAQYDEIIAPLLMEVANKCQELGMALIARVDWGSDQFGITQMGNETASAAQKMTWYAAHSNGNIDALCMELVRKFNVEQSVILSSFPPRT